jgi:hypothetical protein
MDKNPASSTEVESGLLLHKPRSSSGQFGLDLIYNVWSQYLVFGFQIFVKEGFSPFIRTQSIRLADMLWLKIFFADLLWEKNTAEWLADSTDILSKSGTWKMHMLSQLDLISQHNENSNPRVHFYKMYIGI